MTVATGSSPLALEIWRLLDRSRLFIADAGLTFHEICRALGQPSFAATGRHYNPEVVVALDELRHRNIVHMRRGRWYRGPAPVQTVNAIFGEVES